MRKKLRSARQRDHSIQDFTAEIKNLFLMLGVNRDEDRTDVLWYGLDSYYQSKLWESELTPRSAYATVKA